MPRFIPQNLWITSAERKLLIAQLLQWVWKHLPSLNKLHLLSLKLLRNKQPNIPQGWKSKRTMLLKVPNHAEIASCLLTDFDRFLGDYIHWCICSFSVSKFRFKCVLKDTGSYSELLHHVCCWEESRKERVCVLSKIIKPLVLEVEANLYFQDKDAYSQCFNIKKQRIHGQVNDRWLV